MGNASREDAVRLPREMARGVRVAGSGCPDRATRDTRARPDCREVLDHRCARPGSSGASRRSPRDGRRTAAHAEKSASNAFASASGGRARRPRQRVAARGSARATRRARARASNAIVRPPRIAHHARPQAVPAPLPGIERAPGPISSSGARTPGSRISSGKSGAKPSQVSRQRSSFNRPERSRKADDALRSERGDRSSRWASRTSTRSVS